MTADEIAAGLSAEERETVKMLAVYGLISPRSHVPGNLKRLELVAPVWRRGPSMESGYELTPLGREVAALLGGKHDS